MICCVATSPATRSMAESPPWWPSRATRSKKITSANSALETLIGHNSVAWDDVDANSVTVLPAELTLTLEPVEIEEDGDDDEVLEKKTKFRPKLVVSGIKLNTDECQIVLGHASPVDPIVVLADQKYNRLVICSVRDARATRLIQFLLRTDFSETLLDADEAAKFSVGSTVVDSLIRVDLPPQLAGPIVPVTAELVMELRPRPARACPSPSPCTNHAFANWRCPETHPGSCRASPRKDRSDWNATWRPRNSRPMRSSNTSNSTCSRATEIIAGWRRRTRRLLNS